MAGSTDIFVDWTTVVRNSVHNTGVERMYFITPETGDEKGVAGVH